MNGYLFSSQLFFIGPAIMKSVHLAFDLGASSGRAILGRLNGHPATLEIEELHRFEHQPCLTPFGPVWDFTGIWLNLMTGLKRASQWCQQHNEILTSVGIDCWGVDWGLIGSHGNLLMMPHCYRDPFHDEVYPRILEELGGGETVYRRSGIQLMPLNTIFQVAGRFQNDPRPFAAADRLLFVPDLFNFWLSGIVANEETIASTSGLLELATGDWDWELLRQLKLPKRLFGPLTAAGTPLGPIREEIARDVGLSSYPVQVIATASHDTAAAVAAVPADRNQDGSWAYLSSGTWSLLGTELSQSHVSADSFAAPFTNERGIEGRIRFLKNIAGLWLIQELRREWADSQPQLDFAEMVKLAEAAPPLRTLVNPNDSRFATPGGMSEKIKAYATETRQPEPRDLGELVRCCLESLALSYRNTIDRLEAILRTPMSRLHIVGGGSQNQMLNEMTAAALQRPVIVGPVEATAIGNLLVQAKGLGILSDSDQIRDVVTRSFTPTQVDFDPQAYRITADVIQRFRGLA